MNKNRFEAFTEGVFAFAFAFAFAFTLLADHFRIAAAAQRHERYAYGGVAASLAESHCLHPQLNDHRHHVAKSPGVVSHGAPNRPHHDLLESIAARRRRIHSLCDQCTGHVSDAQTLDVPVRIGALILGNGLQLDAQPSRANALLFPGSRPQHHRRNRQGL